MKHATNCKFCKMPITIEIDDAYAELGDPLKLIGLACCNPCADLRVERRNLEAQIKSRCLNRFQIGPKQAKKIEEADRVAVSHLTKKYANLICRWHGKDGMAWDESIVEFLIDKPDKWSTILASMWVHYRKTVNENQKTQEAV